MWQPDLVGDATSDELPVAGPTIGFGAWTDDDRGRPVFQLDLSDIRSSAVVPPAGASDVWHLVGSPGLLALAHGSGRISLYSTTGGMVHLADRTASLRIDGVEVECARSRFELDGVTWTFEHAGVCVVRTLGSDPSSPHLSLRWTITADRPVRIHEQWQLHAIPLIPGPLMSRPEPVPSTHRGPARLMWRAGFVLSGVSRAATDAVRSLAGRRHRLHPIVDPSGRRLQWAPRSPRRRPSGPRIALMVPPTLEMTLADPAQGVSTRLDLLGPTIEVHPPAGTDRASEDHEAVAQIEVSASLRLIDTLIRHRDAISPTGPDEVPEVGATLPGDLSDDPQLAREAIWHVHQLRALRVPDPFIDRTFVTQGSAYAFVHGLHGAIRDEAFVVAALARLDPATAREALLAIASMARPDGMFHYAHAGYGAVLSGGIHSTPTDLPLFYLWAVAEYLGATDDLSVLEDGVAPRGRVGAARQRQTVGDLVVAAARAVDSHVGRGPHGLLRVGSGDWADPISLMVRRRSAFHRSGESSFNTGMALAVLPMVAPLLEALDSPTAGRTAELAGLLGNALDDAWTGRWYLRGWDGRGGPIGASHCFLDAQLWPIIAGHGPRARRAGLVRTIAERCDDPSPIGPAILDRPHRVRLGMLADGWDCNGGVWAALCGLTGWAYALVDPERAEALLGRISFAGQQAAYPDIWYGQWTGPDARNSWMGDRVGETFVHPATPMTEFSALNSNAHAGPLLALEKLRTCGSDRPLRSVGRPGPTAFPDIDQARPTIPSIATVIARTSAGSVSPITSTP